MVSFKQLRTGYLTSYRWFNWKYPVPKELQPSPPPEEKIDPKNLVDLETTLSENEVYNCEYINRNPRNLEQMMLAIKPKGFPLDKRPVHFWNMLAMERTEKHTTAKVVHNSGKAILSASTKEWAIRKQLYSCIDVNAAVNVARVLARRCLESGILFVHHEFSEKEMATMQIQLFLRNLEMEGLQIKEPSAIKLKDRYYL